MALHQFRFEHVKFSTSYCNSMESQPHQVLANFLLKDHVVSVLGLVGHTVSVATSQLCHCSEKAAITMNECGCIPISLNLSK